MKRGLQTILAFLVLVVALVGACLVTASIVEAVGTELQDEAPVVDRGWTATHTTERTLYAGLALQALLEREGGAGTPEEREQQVRRAYAYADDILRLKGMAP